ncbi:MAG: hypothetical protein Q9214_004955 [Letrouitia sp. 1 TL-2023]
MLSWTNVWAVGAVMCEFVLRPDPLIGSRYRWPYDEEGNGIPTISAITSTRYSQALCDLVKDCLRPTASSRPTPFQILDKVELARKRFLRDLKRRRKNGDEVPNQQEALSYSNLKRNDPQIISGRFASTIPLTDVSQWIPQGERLDAPLSPPPGPLRLDAGEER